MKKKTGIPEIDQIEAAHQWREHGIVDVDPSANQLASDTTQGLAGPSGKITKTGDTPWVLVDGIAWGQERVIFAPDGEPAVQIKLKAPRGVDGDPFTFNRVLARFLPDGSIREIMIDFTPPYLETQGLEGTVIEPPQPECPRCKQVKAALDTF